jgi:hypothetical protein
VLQESEAQKGQRVKKVLQEKKEHKAHKDLLVIKD